MPLQGCVCCFKMLCPPCCCRLLPLVVGSLLDAFRPGSAPLTVAQQVQRAMQAPGSASPRTPGAAAHLRSLHDLALAFLCSSSTALQHRALRFAHALLQPAAHALQHSGHSAEQLAVAHLGVLREAGLWRLAFGPAFFFWGGGAGATAASSAAQHAEHAEHDPAAAQQAQQLQQHVLLLLAAAATLPGLPDNEAEVGALVTVLDTAALPSAPEPVAAVEPSSASGSAAANGAGAEQQTVVPEVCACLGRTLEAAPATTAAAAGATNLLGTLTQLLTRIQRALAGPGSSGGGGGSSPGSGGPWPGAPGAAGGGTDSSGGAAGDHVEALCSARFAALSLLATYLSKDASTQLRAVQTWDPVAALFSAIWGGDDATRRLALSTVSSCVPAGCWGHAAAIAVPSTVQCSLWL